MTISVIVNIILQCPMYVHTLKKKQHTGLGMVAQNFNHCTLEVEAGGSQNLKPAWST